MEWAKQFFFQSFWQTDFCGKVVIEIRQDGTAVHPLWRCRKPEHDLRLEMIKKWTIATFHELCYRLSISQAAIDQLRALPKDQRRNIGFRIESMSEDLQGDVKKLKGQPPRYRLRVGAYRVLFTLPTSRAAVTAWASLGKVAAV